MSSFGDNVTVISAVEFMNLFTSQNLSLRILVFTLLTVAAIQLKCSSVFCQRGNLTIFLDVTRTFLNTVEKMVEKNGGPRASLSLFFDFPFLV